MKMKIFNLEICVCAKSSAEMEKKLKSERESEIFGFSVRMWENVVY